MLIKAVIKLSVESFPYTVKTGKTTCSLMYVYKPFTCWLLLRCSVSVLNKFQTNKLFHIYSMCVHVDILSISYIKWIGCYNWSLYQNIVVSYGCC